MSNSLINPESITDRIKDRVKAAFLDVIPDDAWRTLIEQEINAFFNEAVPQMLVEGEKAGGKDSFGQWYNWRQTSSINVKATPFRTLVFQSLYPLVQKRLQETLGDPQFELSIVEEWSGNHREVRVEQLSDFFRKTLHDVAPEMVRLMFEGLLADTANRVKTSLQQTQGY